MALVERLEAAARRRDRPFPRGLLGAVSRAVFDDPGELLRAHEALLFLRAYPHDGAVLSGSEHVLAGFGRRVRRLARAGADLSVLEQPETSGIANTSVTTTYSYDVVRWLARRFGRRVRLDWNGYEGADRLRALFPRFLPLLDEEALEDANVPYLEWLREAQGHPGRALPWLLDSIARFPIPEELRSEAFDALQVAIEWDLGNGTVTRTRMRSRAAQPFFHGEPLIERREVSLSETGGTPRLRIRKASRAEGGRVVDLTRGATALRYREYYGFTYADPSSVRSARVGRGVEIHLMGLERARRLPLRAGFAGFIVKNGVPVGYIEGLALFERIEIGFNIYYTFREGESAWIFGRVLRLLNQLYGATSFSVDPYQLGHENPEAIESGAFWFYRKLGFRPTEPSVARLLEREEQTIAADPKHRSSPGVLRRLVRGNLLFEVDPTRSGAWDHFHVRNVGLAVLRRMRRTYGGDPGRARRGAATRVARALGVAVPRSSEERKTFTDLALVLDLVPGLGRWPRAERAAVAEIVRAKAGREEIGYLRRLQAHERLRRAILHIGSSPAGG